MRAETSAAAPRRAVLRYVATLLPNVSMLLLAGCAGGVLDPKGQIGAAESKILAQCLRHHAGHRGADDRRRARLRLVVPGFQSPGALSARLVVFRPHRTASIWAHSAARHPLSRRRDLDRLARARSLPADRLGPTTPLEVQVVSLDWKWLFIYPEQRIASVNQLVIPVGTPVHFSLTSASVMNAFFVPQLGSMIYTMNGMATQLNLQADQTGDFRGLSAHFSGDGFADMRFHVRVVPQADFDAWVDETRSSACDLDAAGYAELSQPSLNVRAVHLPSVAPDSVPRDRRRRNSRRAQARDSAGRGVRRLPGGGATDMLGKLTLGRDSRGTQPIPLIAGAVVIAICVAIAGLGRGRRASALSLARVDHQRRPQAHRRHVYAARRWSCCCAASPTRIMMRSQQARRLPERRAICRPSTTIRSSRRTARS